mmetsp:Transcript_114261/g.330084  ORF Transcript_114261/g.330084 Transcript_114261/m.330084 type:complete len:207 (-) Transcript_114261:688-1308(-)
MGEDRPEERGQERGAGVQDHRPNPMHAAPHQNDVVRDLLRRLVGDRRGDDAPKDRSATELRRDAHEDAVHEVAEEVADKHGDRRREVQGLVAGADAPAQRPAARRRGGDALFGVGAFRGFGGDQVLAATSALDTVTDEVRADAHEPAGHDCRAPSRCRRGFLKPLAHKVQRLRKHDEHRRGHEHACGEGVQQGEPFGAHAADRRPD